MNPMEARRRARIDDAVLHHWAESGSNTIRAKLKKALQEFTELRKDGKLTTNSEFVHLLYELVWIVLHAKLSRQEVLSLLKDLDMPSTLEACGVFTDLLWVIGNEIEATEKGRERHSSSEWQNLCRFVRAIADEEIIPLLQLKSSLEIDLLHEAGLMPEPQLLTKKVIRINTKTLYTQIKYNLLREETEGFSKVLSLLHTGVSKNQLEATKTDLMALIGFFDLDANRVLDLVLDAYEMHPQNDCFADLLGIFKREIIPHVVGFKFQFYKRESPTEQIVTPRSLYRLAATLISKNLLRLEELIPHLAPSKDEIVKQSVLIMKKVEEEAKSYGRVNLTGKKDEKDGDKDTDQLDQDNDHNQVYGLIVGLLEIGSEKRAFEMVKWFQDCGANPLLYKPLMEQLCALVNSLIAPLYEHLSCRTMKLVPDDKKITIKDSNSTSYVKGLTTYDEFVSVVFPILKMLGCHLHNDELLFTKLLRMIGHLIEEDAKKVKSSGTSNGTETSNDEVRIQIKELVVQSFLPALALQGCNPSFAFQLWDLIKIFPFDERYRMYQQWQESYTKSPQMKLIEAKVVQSTRAVMRRLTADRAKPSARSLTHVAHSNPLIVFRTMLRQIQSYDNLIQPVVESFKFITPLGMDVLSFVLVSELSKSQQSLKSDGTNISLWLTSLASFSGSFYRKYPNVELAGLLQYLIQRLQNWASVDLIVLSELLSKMGSCISFEDISVSQLEAQAGGPHLWHEPSDPKLMNRRAIPRLRDALIKRNLALPLCILICQMRGKIEFHEATKVAHLKLLGRLYDTCQMTLSQLLQFLNGVVDPLVYTKMLPPINELVREYRIPAELAMTLCRPAIRFDDPVLRRAPRSIHSTGAGNNSNGAENGTDTRRTWYMHSPEILEDVDAALKGDSTPKDPFVGLTKEMYIMFWSLILYDIHIPFPQYEAEILRLRNSMSTAAIGTGANGSLSSSERKKLKEKTSLMIDKLTNEQKDQVAHRKRVYERLEEKKSAFFKMEAVSNQTAINELLQRCIIPRSLLSPEDALFSAKFMERIHHINSPAFSAVQYYHKVNLKLPSIVLCLTEREAGNFGIFLKETLTLLHRWYQSSVTYEEEALHGKVTFSLDLHDPTKLLGHRQYKDVYAKWHKWMERVYSSTLSSGDYMPIRNTLVVLTKIIDVFPASKGTAENMLEIMEVLTQEDREDIKIMAKRYFALLTKRKSTLVEDKTLSTKPSQKVREARQAREAKEAAKKEAKADRVDESKPFDTGKVSTSTLSSSSSRSRKTPSVPRQDLESGEIVSSSGDGRTSEKSGKDLNRGSSSKLKRRDSDRGSADDRYNDEKSGGRREASPGKPSASAIAGESESRGSGGAILDEASARKRDRSRDSSRRSRSPDGRRTSRERDRSGNDRMDTATEFSQQSSIGSGGENRKRQRADATEAALRRQLTEKKEQRNTIKAGGRDKPVAGESSSGAKQSETPRGERKIVSLVSRKRERETEALADEGNRPAASTPVSGGEKDNRENRENKRRREGGGGSKGGGSGGIDGEPLSKPPRSQEDKKKRHNKQKHDGNSSGGNINQQQRDQRQNDYRGGGGGSTGGRNNEGRGGGGGNEGSGRRREGNNNDRRGGRR